MRGPEALHDYQLHGIQHTLDHPAVGLFFEMGLGKSAIALTAIDQLMYDRFETDRVLVVAPLRVAQHTWTTEAREWTHLRHLRISQVLGSERARTAALWARADIYVINRENLAWLIRTMGSRFNFDTVVLDELSSFKNAKSQRFRALRKVRGKIKRLIGLTGTPAPNSLLDLWPQLYLMDQGQRLGPTLTGYRAQYFTPDKFINGVAVKYKIRPGAAPEIHRRISDICISMKTEDYLQLPKLITLVNPVALGPEARAEYEQLERDAVLEIQGQEISAVNAAALTGKLLQFTGGAVYSEAKTWVKAHDAKIEALEELTEALLDENALLFYNFQHEADRILARFPQAVKLHGPEQIEAWNRGEIRLLVAHPASAGHGLNLQAGGRRIIWYGLPWSLELYQQAVARLHRQGQTLPVMNHLLVTQGTVEDDVADVLAGKAKTQDKLMEAVKARFNRLKQEDL